jgi:hypothetical protein
VALAGNLHAVAAAPGSPWVADFANADGKIGLIEKLLPARGG